MQTINIQQDWKVQFFTDVFVISGDLIVINLGFFSCLGNLFLFTLQALKVEMVTAFV